MRRTATFECATSGSPSRTPIALSKASTYGVRPPSRFSRLFGFILHLENLFEAVSRLLPLTLAPGFRDVEIRFGPRGLHDVAAVEILRDVRATFSMESIQIDRAVALFVDFDDDGFLFHETSSSANSKPQLDLLTMGRVDDLFALEHVTLGLGDGHGLPLLVDLRKAAQPPIVKADPAVVFTDERA